MTDLFLKQSMKNRVREYCQEKGLIISYELDDYRASLKGVPGYRHIDRRVRELVTAGVLRRLNREDKIMRNIEPKYAVYEWVAKSA